MNGREYDPRKALCTGLVLQGIEDKLEICGIVGMGTSCMTYSVKLSGKDYILKQLYPLGMALRGSIHMTQHGMITEGGLKDKLAWMQKKVAFCRANLIQRSLQRVVELEPYIVHLRGQYRAYGTLFSLADKVNGEAWDRVHGESPERIFEIIVKITELTEKLHSLGWMIVDIKPSNFIIGNEESGLTVRLADFDSMIRTRVRWLYRDYRCSNETAPPELLRNERRKVNTSSDVYSIAAMLCNKLVALDKQTAPEMYVPRIEEKLAGWSERRKQCVFSILDDALEASEYRRIQNCRELVIRLRNIIESD